MDLSNPVGNYRIFILSLKDLAGNNFKFEKSDVEVLSRGCKE